MVEFNPETPFQGERPDNFIAGVVSKQEDMEAAISELRSRNYCTECINVLHGEEGAEAIPRRGEEPGEVSTLQRLRNLLGEFASGGMDIRRRHQEAAAQGNYVVGVILPSDEAEHQEEVHRVLKSYGGYDIAVVRGGTVELLER
jgi:hypothetical protein